MTSPRAAEVVTVVTAFELLETIRARGGARLTELAEAHDLAKSTVHRHLTTLERLGFLVKDDDQYRLGLRFFDFGVHARNRVKKYQVVRKTTQQAAEETGELAVFVVPEHGKAYILCKERGHSAVASETRVGTPVYMHASAGGKCILAHLDRDQVEEVLDEWGLPALTDSTITDQDKLYDELAEIRDRGYAISRDEHTYGLHTVAAPAMDDGKVLGALCISGPAKRMKGERLDVELRDYLLGAVNELELNITYG